jgi:hypothetical protein
VTLPIVSDPFSRLGDEIAGDTPDQIALNLLAVCKISRGRPLLHEPPNLHTIFAEYTLSDDARAALRTADEAFRTSPRNFQ